MDQPVADQDQVDHEVELVPEDEVLGCQRSEQSLASSTTSLADSIRDYVFENGRTYRRYKEGKYNMPNDERENDRMDMQHHMFLMTLGGRLGISPPCQPGAHIQRALDVGTGTGIWAIQYAEDHPEAEVYGVDLSPTQPDFVVPNVKFEIDDIEEEWTYSQPFDYIHSRFMTSSISSWKDYLTKCYDNLSPGGYVELQEAEMDPQADDGSFPPDCALARFATLLKEAAAKFGRVFIEPPKLKPLMAEVGFEDVTLVRYKWPINDWPKDPRWKELGAWNLENNLGAVESLAMAPLTRAHEWSRAEVDVFLMEVRQDLRNRAIHGYFPLYFIYGRKPL
ncbi:methyltransferase domain-containing protein [Colletotrichum kahawae]|uniref:Methyltransferase domain-containing protein n=1 Tax=Colletotrichum kahawae TaxID=34407 RepID=A0AAE0D0H1_COLKA|nr:methyltransferase domain-containing protein [Colletotrichum kahawae]